MLIYFFFNVYNICRRSSEACKCTGKLLCCMKTYIQWLDLIFADVNCRAKPGAWQSHHQVILNWLQILSMLAITSMVVGAMSSKKAALASCPIPSWTMHQWPWISTTNSMAETPGTVTTRALLSPLQPIQVRT